MEAHALLSLSLTHFRGHLSQHTNTYRQRLVAAAFSSKMVDLWQKDSKAFILCKQCTLQKSEAAAATENSSVKEGVPAEVTCCICSATKPNSAYSNANLKLGLIKGNKSKCKQCVLDADKVKREEAAQKKQGNLEELREKARIAEASGDPIAALKALSAASAAEASISTGVNVRKPAAKKFAARGKR